jgi:hypothetical protein
MKKVLLILAKTILFLNLFTNLPTFSQERQFGINPIPEEYLEMGAGMSLQDGSGNTVFSSNYKYCDEKKPCYVMDVYGQLITLSSVFRYGDSYERVVLANETQSLLVTLELKVIDETYEGFTYKGTITIESSKGLTETIEVTGYEGS